MVPNIHMQSPRHNPPHDGNPTTKWAGCARLNPNPGVGDRVAQDAVREICIETCCIPTSVSCCIGHKIDLLTGNSECCRFFFAEVGGRHMSAACSKRRYERTDLRACCVRVGLGSHPVSLALIFVEGGRLCMENKDVRHHSSWVCRDVSTQVTPAIAVTWGTYILRRL